MTTETVLPGTSSFPDKNQVKELAFGAYKAEVERQFPVGAVVKLISGSPKMTVNKIKTDNDGLQVECIYFHDNRELVCVKFSPRVLVSATPPATQLD